jgi:hypothetical protein
VFKTGQSCDSALSHHYEVKRDGPGLENPLCPNSGGKPRPDFKWSFDQIQEGKIEMQNQSKKSYWRRTLLAGVTLAGALLFFGAPAARADDDACQHRIAKADHRLHQAVEHHGWQSRQAANARQQLHEAREYCWSHAKRWWDEDGHRWHTDRDWDDHDHDRDDREHH